MEFEQAFADVEAAAGATVRSAGGLARLAKQLEKAAKDGNIGAIKRTQASFGDSLRALQETVSAAEQSWPYDDNEVQQSLRDGYAAEVHRVASERGLTMFEREGRLIASPSIVRVLLSERAVRIDRKQTSSIRPSALVSALLNSQKKPSAYRSDAFLESLYKVYQELTREDSSGRLMAGTGQVVPLRRVYAMFTSRPGGEREYSHTDFARDLYLLEASGATITRSGATADFPASTGTRSAQGTFTFVDKDGRDVIYYGIRFAGGG